MGPNFPRVAFACQRSLLGPGKARTHYGGKIVSCDVARPWQNAATLLRAARTQEMFGFPTRQLSKSHGKLGCKVTVSDQPFCETSKKRISRATFPFVTVASGFCFAIHERRFIGSQSLLGNSKELMG